MKNRTILVSFLVLIIIINGCIFESSEERAIRYTYEKTEEKLEEDLKEFNLMSACMRKCPEIVEYNERGECVDLCVNTCKNLDCVNSFEYASKYDTNSSIRKCKRQVQEGMIVKCIEWE